MAKQPWLTDSDLYERVPIPAELLGRFDLRPDTTVVLPVRRGCILLHNLKAWQRRLPAAQTGES